MEASTTSRRGAGYVLFAAILFLVLGTFNVIDGIVALAEDDNFVQDELFFGDLTMWGIILLILGLLQLIAAFRLFGGKGQVIALTLLMLGAVAQFFFIPAFPVWSIIILVITLILIYGLTVYGDALEA